MPGTPYEKAVLLDVDTATPEYRAFEKQLYTQALRDLGVFRAFCPRSRNGGSASKKKNGRKVLSDRTETRQWDEQGCLLGADSGRQKTACGQDLNAMEDYPAGAACVYGACRGEKISMTFCKPMRIWRTNTACGTPSA